MNRHTMSRAGHTLLILCAITLLSSCRSSRISLTDKYIVVVDAGHGGNDQGAAGRRSQEKDINLKVAKRVSKYIEKSARNIVVIQTRPDDKFVTLHNRASMANYFRANLFISIHSNSATGWAQGTETFVHPTAKGSKSELLAKYIESEYEQIGRNSRGVKTANFAVLRETNMPAVLTEIGFISNKKEEKYINSKKGQKALARSICNAFLRYYKSTGRETRH